MKITHLRLGDIITHKSAAIRVAFGERFEITGFDQHMICVRQLERNKADLKFAVIKQLELVHRKTIEDKFETDGIE